MRFISPIDTDSGTEGFDMVCDIAGILLTGDFSGGNDGQKVIFFY